MPDAGLGVGQSRHEWLGAFAELFALSGVAITQPFLDVTAKNSELLVVHGTTWFQALALALLVALVPPVACLIVEAGVGRLWGRAVPALHATVCGVLTGVLALEIAKHQTSLRATNLIIVAAIGAIGGALLVAFVSVVRQFLRFLAIGAIAFVPLFLFASPAADVLRSDDTATVAPVRSRTPHRVVLVILDELPTMSLLDGTGHIDRDLYPNFAAFADQATFYRNNTTVAGFTRGAVPAILTGIYPSDQAALPTLAQYPHNVFNLIGDPKDINGHEAVTRLCPTRLCVDRRDRGFGSLASTTLKLWKEFASPKRTVAVPVDANLAGESVDVARAFVQSLEPTTGLHLDLVHLVLPHSPWTRLPNLAQYAVTGIPPTESVLVTPYGPGAATERLRHLLQVQATDTVLGKIMDRLRRIHGYRDSLVIVTADHGAAFAAGEPYRNPTPTNLAQIMWSPLLVKYPGQTAAVVDDRRSETVDIVPTIADVTGVRMPWKVDGHSLRAAAVDRPVRRLYPWIGIPTPLDVHLAPGKSYIDVTGDDEFRTVRSAAAAPTVGEPGLRPYRIGPYGALLGKSVSSIPTGPASALSASIKDPGRFARVDPHAAVIPAVWSEGTVGGTPASTWLAIALDGRIVAVAQTLPIDPRASPFTFLIPPEFLHAGANHLTAFQLTGGPATPSVSRIGPLTS